MNTEDIVLLQSLITHNYSVTTTALALHKSQSAVSKQIMRLESALGAPVVARSNGRIIGLTPIGQAMIDDFNAIVLHLDNIKSKTLGVNNQTSLLRIATTHTQARYVLPSIIYNLRAHNPQCEFRLQQGSPTEVANWVANNVADIAIASEALTLDVRLNSQVCYTWNRRLICQPDHPLVHIPTPTIADLAKHDIVTYSEGFTGRSLIDATFKKNHLSANIVLTAADADVLKTYVKLGFGYGIIADMAYQPATDSDDSTLYSTSLAHVFEPSTTYAALARGKYITPIMRQLLAQLASVQM